MYNRYIPQSDGSYQRNRMQEPQRPKQNPPPKPQPAPKPPEPKQEVPPPAPIRHPPVMQQPQPMGVLPFFRQLLPKNFDTADLLIILLLLLMAGDNEDEKANALLTMALYFLM